MNGPVRDPRLEDFPSLEAFGSELVAGASAGRSRRLGRSIPHGVTLGSFLVAGVVATGAAAAGLTALTGSPIPAPLRADDTVTVWPRDGVSRVAPVRAADPAGGPPWAVRVGGAEGGLVCAAPGQVRGGAFGIVGRDDRFRELPAQVGGGCVSAPSAGRPIVAARAVAGDARGSAGLPTTGTTVVYGLAGPAARSVVVRPAIGPARPLELSHDGAFVVALRGLPDQTQPVVDLEWRDGARRRVDMRQAQTVPDPRGGASWAVSATDDIALDGRQYSAADRSAAARRSGPSCFTVIARGQGAPWICGSAGRGAWTLRPASRPRRPDERASSRWDGPSRTVVLVRTAPGRTPVVRGAGRAWPVRWAGSFGPNRRFDHRDLGWVAVLPPDVAPGNVLVEDRDAGGRAVPVARAVLRQAPPYQAVPARRP
jgi:hypothetical protein